MGGVIKRYEGTVGEASKDVSEKFKAGSTEDLES
tara:strand:+ start:119 stop:220 length:102 start_codon:yes stop_codon:yes gene_type:complete